MIMDRKIHILHDYLKAIISFVNNKQCNKSFERYCDDVTGGWLLGLAYFRVTI